MRAEIVDIIYRYADTVIVFLLAVVFRKLELYFRIRKLFTEEEVMDILRKYKEDQTNTKK